MVPAAALAAAAWRAACCEDHSDVSTATLLRRPMPSGAAAPTMSGMPASGNPWCRLYETTRTRPPPLRCCPDAPKGDGRTHGNAAEMLPADKKLGGRRSSTGAASLAGVDCGRVAECMPSTPCRVRA